MVDSGCVVAYYWIGLCFIFYSKQYYRKTCLVTNGTILSHFSFKKKKFANIFWHCKKTIWPNMNVNEYIVCDDLCLKSNVYIS